MQGCLPLGQVLLLRPEAMQERAELSCQQIIFYLSHLSEDKWSNSRGRTRRSGDRTQLRRGVRVTLVCHCRGLSEQTIGEETLEIQLLNEFTVCAPWAKHVLSLGLSFFVFEMRLLQ